MVNDGDSGQGHTAGVSCLLASGDVAREPISGCCAAYYRTKSSVPGMLQHLFLSWSWWGGGRSVSSCCVYRRPHSPR